jgi:alanine racemase
MYQCERAYARVYLDRIEENMAAMQEKLKTGTGMIGVVKTDGYGHGAVAVAKTIDRFVMGFAVATVDEAIELREHGIEKGILILGPVAETRYEDLFTYGLRPSIFQLEKARCLSRISELCGKTLRIHIAVDTGMSRIGFAPTREAAETVKLISELPGIEIEGIFTHFARADERDKSAARAQLAKFQSFIFMLKELGVMIPICHCANSAGLMEMPEADMNAVRAGISIYGLYPSDEMDRENVVLKPAMELKSFLTYIKEIGPGTAVSYGGTYIAEKTMRVGTVSIGYGDGYPRSLSGKGYVLVCGKKAPILGRVCMDQFMVDLTEIPEAAENAEVTLLGSDGDQTITMEELASLSGGFHYEIPCLISMRVPRVYSYHGRDVAVRTASRGDYREIR